MDSFYTLVARFGMQFVTSRPHHLTFMALINIRQEKKESLGTFMEHFRKVALNIRNLIGPSGGYAPLDNDIMIGTFCE